MIKYLLYPGFLLAAVFCFTAYLLYGHHDFLNPDLGQTLLHVKDAASGHVPYKDISNHHFLGYIIPFVLIEKILPLSPKTFWFLGAAYHLLWAAALSAILKVMGLRPVLALMSFLTFLTSGWFFHWSGFSFNVQMYFNPFISLFFLMLYLSYKDKSKIFLYLAAVLLGYLYTCDQRFLLLGVLWLGTSIILFKAKVCSVREIVLATLLTFLPPLLILAYLFFNGALVDFFNQTLIFPFTYRNKGVVEDVWLWEYFLGELPMLGAALFGAWYLFFRRKEYFLLWLLGFWCLLGVIFVELAGRGYPHYYLIFSTPVALLSASLLLAAQDLKSKSILIACCALLLMSGMPKSMKAFIGFLQGSLPLERVETVTHQAADFIVSKTKPDDKIFVWGYAPNLYLYTDRRPAFRDVSLLTISGGNFSSGKEDEQGLVASEVKKFRQMFDQNPPAAFVFYKEFETLKHINLRQRNLDYNKLKHLKYIKSALDSNYKLEKTFTYKELEIEIYLLGSKKHTAKVDS